MVRAAFRIDGVTIEGFKAFTERQSFQFDGRHVFLFGPNGSGKTSIIEGIRWCLFGQAAHRGEIVKNQFYTDGPCIVQMKLAAPDGRWTLQRRLRPSGNESDLTVRDPGGTERNLEDVFPQLSRIGPSEGTHVIYAAQQPSSRRPEADITDFRYVVYRYLGLEEVPRLTDVLLGLSRDWQVQEDEICGRVDLLGEEMSRRITEIDRNLESFSIDPPWGTGVTPTNVQTNGKIEELAVEAEALGAGISADGLTSLDSGSKLYEVETAINQFLARGVTELEQGLSERSNRLQNAEALLVRGKLAVSEITELTSKVKNLRYELVSTLNGHRVEELETQLQLAEANLQSTQLKMEIVQATLRFLNALENDVSTGHCPACDAAIEADKLKSRIEGTRIAGDNQSNEVSMQREKLKDQISRSKRLEDEISDIESGITENQASLNEILDEAMHEFELSAIPSLEALTGHIEELRNACDDLQSAVESESESNNVWSSRIENLRQELRFQGFRSLKARLQTLYDGRFVPLHDSLKDLTDLRDVADETRMLLNSKLHERLEEDLPPVAEEMTEVYLRLTETPTFDSIRIDQGETPDGGTTLDLRVSSSRGPGTWGVEHGVLNGQALNAIQLVPYFVFSRYQEEPLLDLLLLDDPTQAFDTKKIELLLGELHKAASHATLFVATHEAERFIPIIQELFNDIQVNAYRALGIDENGPRFEDVQINL